MKALSVLQPWASLIVIGAKRIETRSWACPPGMVGETIAIHASAGFKRECRELCADERFYEPLALAYRENAGDQFWFDEWTKNLPLGAVLGTARIVGCYRIGQWHHATEGVRPTVRGQAISDVERAFGDYTLGRYAWLLDDVRRFSTPVPAKGALGFWTWEGGSQ